MKSSWRWPKMRKGVQPKLDVFTKPLQGVLGGPWVALRQPRNRRERGRGRTTQTGTKLYETMSDRFVTGTRWRRDNLKLQHRTHEPSEGEIAHSSFCRANMADTNSWEHAVKKQAKKTATTSSWATRAAISCATWKGSEPALALMSRTRKLVSDFDTISDYTVLTSPYLIFRISNSDLALCVVSN